MRKVIPRTPEEYAVILEVLAGGGTQSVLASRLPHRNLIWCQNAILAVRRALAGTCVGCSKPTATPWDGIDVPSFAMCEPCREAQRVRSFDRRHSRVAQRLCTVCARPLGNGTMTLCEQHAQYARGYTKRALAKRRVRGPKRPPSVPGFLPTRWAHAYKAFSSLDLRGRDVVELFGGGGHAARLFHTAGARIAVFNDLDPNVVEAARQAGPEFGLSRITSVDALELIPLEDREGVIFSADPPWPGPCPYPIAFDRHVELLSCLDGSMGDYIFMSGSSAATRRVLDAVPLRRGRVFRYGTIQGHMIVVTTLPVDLKVLL